MEQFDKKVRKAEIVVTPKVPSNTDRFVPFPMEVINSQRFREENQTPLMLFFFIASRIVRKHMNDGLYIYENYYRNETLACSLSHGQLAKAFGVSTRTTIRWIKELEKNELLRIEKVAIDEYRKKNVYIVGTHDGFTECFYINEIYS